MACKWRNQRQIHLDGQQEVDRNGEYFVKNYYIKSSTNDQSFKTEFFWNSAICYMNI